MHEYLYYIPAMKLAAYIGVRYGITKGELCERRRPCLLHARPACLPARLPACMHDEGLPACHVPWASPHSKTPTRPHAHSPTHPPTQTTRTSSTAGTTTCPTWSRVSLQGGGGDERAAAGGRQRPGPCTRRALPPSLTPPPLPSPPRPVGGIVAQAIRASNGRPLYVNEAVWLSNFLNLRENVLRTSGRVWGQSVNRVKAYRDILAAGGWVG